MRDEIWVNGKGVVEKHSLLPTRKRIIALMLDIINIAPYTSEIWEIVLYLKNLITHG